MVVSGWIGVRLNRYTLFGILLAAAVSLTTATLGAVDTEPAAQAGDTPHCGVIIDASAKDVPAAALFETAMLPEAQIIPVERTVIHKLITEQELQAMFSPEDVAKRKLLGSMVKADLLVLVRRGQFATRHPGDRILIPGEVSPGTVNHWMEIVVFETKHGLRLQVGTETISDNPQADSDAMVSMVHQALARYRHPAHLIFSVLPFENRNIAHDLDSAEALFPSILEEQLLKNPDTLVVALPEARALAEEVALAGGEQPWRQLPFFITGSFDATGIGKGARLGLRLDLGRSGKTLDEASGAGVEVAGLPAFFSDVANRFHAAADKAGPPPPTQQPENVIEAAELAQQVEGFARIGDWAQVVAVAQAALLLNPSLVRMHGLIYAGLCHIAFYTFGRGGLQDLPAPGQLEAALAFFSNSLPHLEIYMENTPIDRMYEHDSDARLMLYWRVIRMFLANSPTPAQQWIEADKAARATLWRILRYKSDHKVQDCAAEVCVKYLEPIELLRSASPQQKAQLYQDNSDLRVGLLKQFAYRHDTEELCKGILWPTGDLPEATWAAVRKKIAAIGSPAILAEEDQLRAGGIALIKQRQDEADRRAREAAAPPPRIDNPDIEFKPLAFSVQEKSSAPAAVVNPIGCLPIGADADIIWTASNIYEMSKVQPGVLHPIVGPAAPLPRGAADSDPDIPLLQKLTSAGACFDGRLAWFIVELDRTTVANQGGDSYVVSTPVGWMLSAIDPRAHHIYVITRDVGLPPTPNAIAPLSPGKVCVSGWFRRTWCAVASVDVDAPHPSAAVKVIYEGRGLPTRAWDPDPSPSIAYKIHYLAPLPSIDPAPPNRPLPRVLARRGPGFLLLDPNTASVTPLADPFPDRQTGSSATLVVGNTVYWQGRLDVSHGALRISTLDHLAPASPPIDLTPGPLVFHWGLLNHVDPAKHQWSVSPDGRHPFLPLRGYVSDSDQSPGVLMASNAYGLLLMNSGAQQKTYQVSLLHLPPATEPATRP